MSAQRLLRQRRLLGENGPSQSLARTSGFTLATPSGPSAASNIDITKATPIWTAPRSPPDTGTAPAWTLLIVDAADAMMVHAATTRFFGYRLKARSRWTVPTDLASSSKRQWTDLRSIGGACRFGMAVGVTLDFSCRVGQFAEDHPTRYRAVRHGARWRETVTLNGDNLIVRLNDFHDTDIAPTVSVG